MPQMLQELSSFRQIACRNANAILIDDGGSNPK